MTNREELRQLVNRLLDEELAPAERAQLNELLRGDPEACEYYLEMMAVHAQLEREFGVATPAGGAPSGTAGATLGPGRRGWWAWAGAALALAAAIAIMLLVRTRPNPPARVGSDAKYVATLLDQNAAQWSDGRRMLRGQRIAAGRLRLQAGRAVVGLDAGAEMVLLAPADVVIESAGGVKLNSGKIAARAPEEAYGFHVNTVEGSLIDLGTEFTLAIDQAGGTVCQVLAGEVEWHPAGAQQRVATFTEGNARRFVAGRTETIDALPARFQDYLPQPSRPYRQAELLAYEPFDYQPGELPADTLSGGMGWRSPWQGRFATGDTLDPDPRMLIVADAGIATPEGLPPGKGGSFVFHEPRQWRLRALQSPIDFGRDGVYYVSFLVRRPPQSGEPNEKSGRFVVTLRSLADYWTHSVGFAITSDNRPVILADGNNSSADTTVPADSTLFVVCKIATSASGPDQLFMKVYSPDERVDRRDTSRWTVTGRELQLGLQMDYLILGMMGDVRWTIDELRVGSSWRAVVPLPDT